MLRQLDKSGTNMGDKLFATYCYYASRSYHKYLIKKGNYHWLPNAQPFNVGVLSFYKVVKLPITGYFIGRNFYYSFTILYVII